MNVLIWFIPGIKAALIVRNHFVSAPYSLRFDLIFGVFRSMGVNEESKEACGTICLKYLLFVFNFMFWVSLLSAMGEPLLRV